MCGIAVLAGESASHEVLARMLRVARRRGPEQTRTLAMGDCLFGHAALGFVDVGHNEQPYVRDDRALVWNGEIYNWPTLVPSARNDTQALLTGLHAHGAT